MRSRLKRITQSATRTTLTLVTIVQEDTLLVQNIFMVFRGLRTLDMISISKSTSPATTTPQLRLPATTPAMRISGGCITMEAVTFGHLLHRDEPCSKLSTSGQQDRA